MITLTLAFFTAFCNMRAPLALLGLAAAVSADFIDAMHRQRARSIAVDNVMRAEAPSRGVYKRQDGSSISFANPAAEQFFVDGTSIPDGAFDDWTASQSLTS